MAGTGTSLLILAVGFGRLAWIAAHARRVRQGPWVTAAADVPGEYGLRRPVLLLQATHPALLVTWGLVRPKILLPRTASHWSDDRVRIVLCNRLRQVDAAHFGTQRRIQVFDRNRHARPIVRTTPI